MAPVHGIPSTRGKLRQSRRAAFLGVFKAAAAWWRSLPDRVVTRRGLMELSDPDLRDLGLRRKHAADGSLRRAWRL